MIQIKSSELVEFKALLERLSFDKAAYERDECLIANDHLIDLMNRIDHNISTFLSTEINYYSKTLLVHMMIMHLVITKEFEFVVDYIEYIKSLSSRELLDLYLTSIIERSVEDPISEVIDDIIADDYYDSLGVNVEDIREFIEDFEIHRDRIVLYFEKTYEKLFKPFASEIMSIQKEESVKFEKWYQKDPKQFIQILFKVNVEEVLADQYDADFYVSITYPSNIGYIMIKDHPEMMYVTFGYTVAERFKAADSEGIIKLLGEATKMRIVKMLSQKSMYQSEIAQAVGLNRATIGHHISQLTQSGMIQVAYSKGKRAYYELNIERIEEGLCEYVNYLKGGLHE